MSDNEQLNGLLRKLGLEDRVDEVLSKTNINGPTTKIDTNGNLVWVDLSGMGIKELPVDTFEGLPHLQELKLFKNEIQILPDEIFDPVPNLTELHLKDNNLKELKYRHLKNLSHLQRLFLLGNDKLGRMAKVYPNPIAVNQFLNQLKEQE